MPRQNDELLTRLLGIFRIEAEEHLQVLSSCLLELEARPSDERYAEIVEKIFREAHSLKGAARTVNLKDIESICQALESVLSGLKARRLVLSQPLIDLVYSSIDLLAKMIVPGHENSEHDQPMVKQLLHRLKDALTGDNPKPDQRLSEDTNPVLQVTGGTEAPERPIMPEAPLSSPAAGDTSKTVRVSAHKFDALMRQIEELLSARLAVAQRGLELRDVAADLAQWRKRQQLVRPALRLLDRYDDNNDRGAAGVKRELRKVLEYVEMESTAMKALEDRVHRLCRANEHDKYHLGTMIDVLLDNAKEMYLLPFVSVLEGFPRIVRELAKEQGKQVELALQGGEIQIDRRILDTMKDPLTHLLRNAVDHGIELPGVRREKGKPEQAKIDIAITQIDSGKIEILITDDGAGIDTSKVKDAALRLGKVAAGDIDKLTDADLQSLVFYSGISTSPIVSDVSGRGLGLAIVQEKVEKIGGAIALYSKPGAGTSFRIILPLAMATIRGLLVAVAERLFVIPAISVERVLRMTKEDVRTVENRDTIMVDEQAMSLVELGDILRLRTVPVTDPGAKAPVVVLAVGSVRIAFRVDAILGEQEVAVRPLGSQLVRVPNIGGATVLGNGDVVPVLNVSDLLKSAVKCEYRESMASVPEKSAAIAKTAILVVEDSITSRVLLKNILESAGYQVATAIDGVDAFTALKTGVYDLVVSDVEMPRMDGFSLTAKIRADRALADLPVVLVTAMESSEDRERGIDVGANAYIVKSSFDQSNLLEVVSRFV